MIAPRIDDRKCKFHFCAYTFFSSSLVHAALINFEYLIFYTCTHVDVDVRIATTQFKLSIISNRREKENSECESHM